MRKPQRELVRCVREREPDVCRQPSWKYQYDEPDQGAVFAAERQGNDDAFVLQLETAHREERFA